VHQIFKNHLTISDGAVRPLTPDLTVKYVGSIKGIRIGLPDVSNFIVEIAKETSVPTLADWLYKNFRSQMKLEIEEQEVSLGKHEIASALLQKLRLNQNRSVRHRDSVTISA
jgi:hypothetical protein